MKDKIEEREKIMQIVINHWFDDNSIQLEEIADEILTLIQEERKEAVEGLLKWFEGKKVRECFKELNDKYTGEEYIETIEGYHYLQGFVEEYLESEENMKNIKENIELINCEIPTGVPIIFTKRKNYVGYKVVEPITDTSEIKKKFREKFEYR